MPSPPNASRGTLFTFSALYRSLPFAASLINFKHFSVLKILTASFPAVKEYTYTGTIGSGKLEADAPVVTEPVVTEAPATEAPATQAPATDAPVVTEAPAVDTTVAPAEPEVTPSTGDSSAVVFAISAACLVAAAAMVFLKKRVTE